MGLNIGQVLILKNRAPLMFFIVIDNLIWQSSVLRMPLHINPWSRMTEVYLRPFKKQVLIPSPNSLNNVLWFFVCLLFVVLFWCLCFETGSFAYPRLASYLLGGCGRDIMHALCSADYKTQGFMCSNQLDPLLEQFFAFVRLKSATQIPSFKIFFLFCGSAWMHICVPWCVWCHWGPEEASVPRTWSYRQLWAIV